MNPSSETKSCSVARTKHPKNTASLCVTFWYHIKTVLAPDPIFSRLNHRRRQFKSTRIHKKVISISHKIWSLLELGLIRHKKCSLQSNQFCSVIRSEQALRRIHMRYLFPLWRRHNSVWTRLDVSGHVRPWLAHIHSILSVVSNPSPVIDDEWLTFDWTQLSHYPSPTAAHFSSQTHLGAVQIIR